MATGQYIGARYVPKFYQNSVDGSANWESNVVYEPLTYVTLTNGHMYISKKQVPATVGTPAANVDYWLDVGNYNGFIDELQSQIGDLNDLIVPNVSDLVSAVNETYERATSKRKYIFIGDSYATGQGPDVTVTDYVTTIISLFNLTASDYYRAQQGGASWKGFSGRPSYQSLLESLSSTITDKDSITDIIVCGGVNDTSGTVSDGQGAMATFRNYVASNYPNATVRVGFIGWSSDRATRWLMYQISYPLYTTCGFVGFQALDIPIPILHGYSTDFQSDGVHPNATGQNKLAWCIAGALSGGKGRFTNPSYSTFVTKTNGVFSTDLTFDKRVTQDAIIISAQGKTLNFNSGATFSWLTDIEICRFTSNPDIDFLMSSDGVQTAAILGWNDGTTHMTPCTAVLWIRDNKLYMRFSGDTTITPSGLVFLIISKFTASLVPVCC